MPKCETTKVPAMTTWGQIERLLRSHGATSIAPVSEYDPKTRVLVGLAFCFEMNVKGTVFPFRFDMPIRKVARERDRAQAERTAYRQFFWWLENNLNLVDLGFIDLERVLLAWIAVMGPEGKTTVGNLMLQAITAGSLQPALADGRSQ
jgi:hypothetical protein